MEIKILCSCGSKYKFDLEPVDGRAPAELSCPNCGSSWTATANAMIAQSLGGPPAGPVETPAPAPVRHAAAVDGPVRLNIPVKTGLRIGGHAPAQNEPPVAEAAGEAEPAGETAPAPAPGAKRKKKFSPKVAAFDVVKEEATDWGKFGLGATGALIGAIIGGIVYYLLYKAEIENKLMALGVAAIAGGVARAMGRKGCSELGMLTAAFSIAAILAAQYFVARYWYLEADTVFGKAIYEYTVEEAKEAVAAVPNGTDDEIRIYLAKPMLDEEDEDFEEDMRIDPADITQMDIDQFRTNSLPMYREVAAGMSFEDWKKKHLGADEEEEVVQTDEEKQADERTVTFFFLLLAVNKANIICIGAAAGLAYKMTDI